MSFFKKYLKINSIILRYCYYALDNNVDFDVLILPGAGDFIEKIEHFSIKLSKENIRVIVIDLPGQGFSSRFTKNNNIRHIVNYNNYYDSIEKIILHEKLGYKRPFILIGHSLGGFLSLSYLFRHDLINSEKPIIFPDKIISITPMITLNLLNVDKFLIILIDYLLKILRLSYLTFPKLFIYILIKLKLTHSNTVNNISLSSERWKTKENIKYFGKTEVERVLNIYQHYPHLDMAGPSWHWTSLTIKICKKFLKLKLYDKIDNPVMIINAENEKVVNTQGIEILKNNIKNNEYIKLKNSSHFVFHEQKKIQDYMFKSIIQFIKK